MDKEKYSPKVIDVKGKQYVQVYERIEWMLHDKKPWVFNCELVHVDGDIAVVRCEILENEKMISSDLGACKAKDFQRYVEKAATAAKGRALANLGYGTADAFIDDDSIGENEDCSQLVDSPIPAKNNKKTIDPSICECGNQMMISRYPEDVPVEERPWYCSSCKRKVPRG
jgi:hypothetical protein